MLPILIRKKLMTEFSLTAAEAAELMKEHDRFEGEALYTRCREKQEERDRELAFVKGENERVAALLLEMRTMATDIGADDIVLEIIHHRPGILLEIGVSAPGDSGFRLNEGMDVRDFYAAVNEIKNETGRIDSLSFLNILRRLRAKSRQELMEVYGGSMPSD
jgi:hypothetical protein